MNNNKKFKKFMTLAACIAVIGSTASPAFSDAITVSISAVANGATGIISNQNSSHTSTDYTWKKGATDSVEANLTSGTLTISNYSNSIVNGTLNATGGTIKLTSGVLTIGSDSTISSAILNQSYGSTLNIAGGSAYLSDSDSLEGEIVVSSGILGLDGANLNDDLTITGGGVISDSNTVINGTTTISGGSNDFNSTTFGNVSISDGTSSFTDVSKNGTFTQTSGSTTIVGSGFDLNNDADNISGGTLNIGNGSTTTVGVSAGTIGSDTTVNIDKNSTLNVSDGNISLDSGDTWNGNVNISGGELALIGISKKNSAKFTQTGGSTTITGNGFNLNNSSDSILGGDLNIGNDATTGNMTVSNGVLYEGANVTINSGSSLDVAGGNVTLDGATDKWNGSVSNSGGTLTLKDVKKNSNGTFSQTDGTTTVTGTSFTMNNSADTISGGTLNVGTSTSTGKLTVSSGSITEDATLNIDTNGTIDIKKGDVTIDNSDTWAGNVEVNGGTLNVSNATKTGSLTQNGGTINVTGKKFNLNSTEDLLDGGTLNIGDGSTSSKMTVSKGTITSDTTLNLNDKTTLNIAGGNVSMGSDSTWAGNVNMSSGNLALVGITKTGTLTQTGGSTTVTGNKFDLNNDNDYISGGSLTIGNGTASSTMAVSKGAISKDTDITISKNSTLNVSGGNVEVGSTGTWNGNISISNGNLTLDSTSKNDNGTFTQTGGKTDVLGTGFDLDNASDIISAGTLNIGNKTTTSDLTVSAGTIESDATINITKKGTLNVSGGDVALDDGDSWNGNVNVTDGTLKLSNINKNSSGKFTQSGGNTTINSANFNLDNSDDSITGGSLVVGDASATNLNISNGTLGQNAKLTLSSGSNLNISGGSVSLDNTDVLEGNVNVAGGSLALVGINNKKGTFNQTKGTTTVTETGFDMNTSSDSITGGTLNIGDGTTVSDMSVSQGTIGANTTVNIKDNATLNVSGGNVNLNKNGSWDGNVNVSTGTLNIDSLSKGENGIFAQGGGTTTVTGSGFDLNNLSDSVAGGTFNIGDGTKVTELTVSKGSIQSGATTVINSNSKLKVKGGKVTLDSGDTINGDVDVSDGTLTLDSVAKNNASIFTQTGGTTNVTGSGFDLNNSADNISGGTLNIGTTSDSSSMTVSKGTISADTAVNIATNGTINITGSSLTLNNNDDWNGKVNVTGGNLNLAGIAKNSSGVLTQTSGTTTVTGSGNTLNNENDNISGGNLVVGTSDTNGELNVENGTIAQGTNVTINEKGSLKVKGGNVTIDGSDTWNGEVSNSGGTLNLTNKLSKTTTSKVKFNQTNGTTNINESKLVLNTSDSTITGGSINLGTSSELDINNSSENSSAINATGGKFSIRKGSKHTITGGTVAKDAEITVESSAKLGVNGDDANVTLDGTTDTVDGSIELSKGKLYISDDLTKVTDENGNYVQTGGSLTMSNSTLSLADKTSSISGGDVNLTNRSTLNITNGGGSAITGGNITIDDSSVLNYLAQKGLIQYSDGNQININTSGLINMANNVRTNSVINNLTVNNGSFGDGQADFAIDIRARNNSDSSADTITANSIKVATSGTNGTIRISDYNLNGDIFGYDAPIDKSIRLGKIFKTDNLDSEVQFAATDKEIFTPIGYYKLNPSSANDGSYTFDLARYNPQVFRGQVSTAASYMNQLVVNDTLFNRAQIRRYGSSYNEMFKNKTAILDGNASFERTLKEGQLWTEAFGNFETLKFNHDLDKVRNNSWGFIVGGDFGLKELKNGWSWMPTMYIAYNGGHQTFNKVGIYENGGQLGFMSSFMKDKFMETALVYAGAYGTEMNIVGSSEDAFNYFVGVASKTAYDWNWGSHFKVQPSLTLAYNMFGKQNWHSDFGQMGMSSGFLNGFNVAPGVNFILQQESWSMYATVSYAWNFFGGMDGRAGNVDLPHIRMSNGYLQYGFGMTKSFSDRFNMYAQATMRNIGRTGIICQGGLNWRL